MKVILESTRGVRSNPSPPGVSFCSNHADFFAVWMTSVSVYFFLVDFSCRG